MSRPSEIILKIILQSLFVLTLGFLPGAALRAEDLTVMPVVSLHQDLTVVAAMGLSNVERNAHHFFAGIARLPFMLP